MGLVAIFIHNNLVNRSIDQLPVQGWKTHKNRTRFEPEPRQPMIHSKSCKDDESSGDGVGVGSCSLTSSKKHMRRRQLVPTYNASTPFTRLENTQD